MRPLSEKHGVWLANYRQSPLYGCSAVRNNCQIFHVLAPVLHDAGIFRSYESYGAIIRELLIDALCSQDTVRILVAGIDSESSARALIANVEVFCPRVQATFIDRCPTPLNRIKHALCSSENYVETLTQEISVDSTAMPEPCYDFVFADSFIKQFPRRSKRNVLLFLANYLRSEHSRMILREYFGCLDDLLPPLWSQLASPSPGYHAAGMRESSYWSTLLTMIPSLDRHMKATGEIYREPEELVADLEDGGLTLVDRYCNPAEPDLVFVAKKQ